MTCPLTTAYLKEVSAKLKHYDQTRVLWGTVIDTLDNLLERASDLQDSRECQRLRAFWCIEMMYLELPTRCFVQGHWDAVINDLVPRFITQQPRSWEGLGNITKAVDDFEGELYIQLAELGFARKSMIGDNVDVFTESALQNTISTLKSCSEAAKLLRRSLGNNDLAIHGIGKSFAETVEKLSIPYQQHVEYGVVLLNISPDEPTTPWKTHVSQG
jgi:hypothetical protein